MGKIKYLSLMLLSVALSLSFMACSSDEDDGRKLNQSELSLIAGQSVKLVYDGGCTWKSEEPLIAEVDNNGNVTANRVGETIIWANDEKCKIRVSPKYNTYMEPCIKWNASESEVIDFMKGYQYLGKNDNTLSFIDDDKNFAYVYIFKNNLLSSSAIATNILSYGEEVSNFLLERYVVVNVDKTNNICYLASIDMTIAVLVYFESNDGLMTVIYLPFNVDSVDVISKISDLKSRISKKQMLYNVDIVNDLVDKFTK